MNVFLRGAEGKCKKDTDYSEGNPIPVSQMLREDMWNFHNCQRKGFLVRQCYNTESDLNADRFQMCQRILQRIIQMLLHQIACLLNLS